MWVDIFQPTIEKWAAAVVENAVAAVAATIAAAAASIQWELARVTLTIFVE